MKYVSSVLVGAVAVALSCALACSSSTSVADTSAQNDGGAVADGGDAGAAHADGAGPTTTTDGGSDAPSSSATCGITLQGTKWPTACQSWLDQNCCAEEQACAGDSECQALVACMNACPSPPQDSCLNACGADAGAATIDHFSAIGDCSKKSPPDGGADIPDNCAWPR